MVLLLLLLMTHTHQPPIFIE
eukprot:COSAG01_NODE_26439_length_714_cov_0.905691_1_plen_20_part_10